MTPSRNGLFFGLLAYMIVMRWLPYILQNCDVRLDPSVTYYPWSFSPLTAVCLLSGVMMRDVRWGLALPLIALFIGDVGIGFLSGHWEWAFPGNTWWLTYVCYSMPILLGRTLRRTGTKPRVASAVAFGLLFEVGYFFVSNLVVWSTSAMYEHTLEGLMNCFILALPFFRWSPVSTTFFTVLVFGPLGAFATNDSAFAASEIEPVPVR